MEVIKKNLVSIICGVVALAAVAVAFTVLTGRAQKLQEDLTASQHTRQQLADLMKKPRTLPQIDPDKPEAEKLLKFPNQKIIDQGNDMTKKLTEESKAMMDEAVKMNQHALLEPGSLPDPSSIAAYNFRGTYQRYFAQQGQNPLDTQLARDLTAGMPPPAEDIRAAQEKMAADIRKNKTRLNSSGQPVNQQEVDAEVADRSRKLPQEMRKTIAETKKVYINPTTFQQWPAIMTGAGAPDAVDIYKAQLALWLDQDVIAAVNDANKDAHNIKDATVKNLIQVVAIPQPVLPAAGQPTADPDAQIPKEPTASPTGRVTNGMFDVYHIVITADVDAAKLPDFLRALGKNRFLTPLSVDVKSVDNAFELAQGHDYGSTVVLNVKVKCEDLYLRQWLRPLMPKKVRTDLGLPPEEPKPEASATQPTASAQQ